VTQTLGNTLTVPGQPFPKARPRFNRKQGRVYTPADSLLAEDLMASVMNLSLAPLGGEDVLLDVHFAFETRKSGDLDNCLKLVMDALQKARVIDNDRQVRQVRVACSDVAKGDAFTRVTLHVLIA